MAGFHFICLFSVVLLNLISTLIDLSDAQTNNYAYNFCGTTGNFSDGSAYERNLNLLLSSLSSDVLRNGNNGFKKASVGQDSDRVYGLFLCRGDVSPQFCRSCADLAREDALKRCPNQKESIVHYEDCMLRYSNRSFFSIMETDPALFLYNTQTVSNRNNFDKILSNMLEDLEDQASGDPNISVSKFASVLVNYTALQPLYGLMQCTPDLSTRDCRECLQEARANLPYCCDGRIGARVILPSCSLRYDIRSFYESRVVKTPSYNSTSKLQNPTSPSSSPASAPASTIFPVREDGASNKTLIAALSSGGAFIVLVTLAILCIWRRKSFSDKLKARFKKKTENAKNFEAFLLKHGPLPLTRFNYSDVKKMTNSFQDKLGQGGYGSVFKGRLLDGRMVAVKLLNESKGNGEEFINEIASISRTSHINIVTLLGFCIENTKRALIYEFMPNGSLEKFIYDNATHPHLGWKRLYDIAFGIARGLEYLHRGCNTRILHFDIKPHNILLDQDFYPKISDFGLSKLCFPKESIISMSGARGTPGYIAPELISRNFGMVSHKSDVYSYGMMVLEIVGGRKNIDVGVANISEIYFPEWVYKHLNDQSSNLGLRGVASAEDEEIARKMVTVGLWCIQIDPANRPSISMVLDMLKGRLDELQIPPNPFPSSPPILLEDEFSSSESIL